MKSIALLLLAAVFPLQGQTASELLQKGIYLQETVGDLDAAMNLYKQVRQMSQESRASAAQAQYRLGVCLQKKGQRAEATRTFQQLVEEYPEQTDLVAKVKAVAPSGLKLLPPPWAEGEMLDFEISMPNAPAGTVVMRYSVRASKTNSRDLVFETRIYSPVVSFLMQSEADRDTMRPVSSHSLQPMAGEVQTRYRGTEGLVQIKGQEPRSVALDGVTFDEHELFGVIRRLPLEVGYKTTFSLLSNAAANLSKISVAVVGMDDVKTPAGNFHAYRVEVNNAAQKLWISSDSSRYLVKQESGTMMTGVLSAIHRGDESSVFRSDKLGISLNVPAGWTAREFPSLAPALDPSVCLVDIDSPAVITISVQRKKWDHPPTGSEVRADAEKEAPRSFPPGQRIRSNSWETRQVSGNPAVSWVADYTDIFKRPAISYTVQVAGLSSAVKISAQVDAKELQALRPRLDAIIDTLIIK